MSKALKLKPSKHERTVAATIHRASQHSEDRDRRMTRKYSKVANAFNRMLGFMAMNGYVGDVCEIYHTLSGMQLGTIKISATGRLKFWVNIEGK